MTNKEKIVLGIAGLLVIAGVALGASGKLSFGEKPHVVVQKMIDARSSVTSEHMTMKLSGSVDAGDQGTMLFSIASTGVVTQSDVDLGFTAQISQAGTTATPIDVKGDLRSLANIVYVRVTQMPSIPFIKPELVMNTWFSIDPVSLSKKFGTADEAAQLQTLLKGKYHMPQAFYTEAYSLALSEGVIMSAVNKGSETISGIATDKYEFTINPRKIPAFVPKYVALYNKYAAQQGLSELPMPSSTSDSDVASLSNMQLSPVAVWIGKTDNLPYKAAGSLSVRGTSSAGKMVNSSASFEVVISDYNKPVTIEKPTPVIPIENLIQTLMGGMMGPSK